LFGRLGASPVQSGAAADRPEFMFERHSAQLSESRGSVICCGFPNRIRHGAGALLGVRSAVLLAVAGLAFALM
jgi:hypothetical protein